MCATAQSLSLSQRRSMTGGGGVVVLAEGGVVVLAEGGVVVLAEGGVGPS